jgi:GntR family transcriptional regulator
VPTLYQTIAAELTRKISSGQVKVGTGLPTERQLMIDFDASRNTVRAALAQLDATGLITRQRKRGSTVVSQVGASTFVQSLSNLEDLVSFAKSAVRQVRHASLVVVDIALARELGCAPGSRWLHVAMTRTKSKGPAPLAWTDAYVEPAYAEMGELASLYPDRLLSDLIEVKYGRRISAVEQTVTSCLIEGQTQVDLELAAPTHGLKIVRRYRDGSKAMVLMTRSVYPGELYAMTTNLVRSTPA